MPARTPLYDVQAAAGAKMVDFAGWDMPVQFAGIQAEHVAVRTAAGVFDVSHMGRLRVVGPGAVAFLTRRVCRRVRDLASGQVRYALVLAEDGTVEDDVLVSRVGDLEFHVVVNAGNRAKILAAWLPESGPQVAVHDLSPDQAMLAVQGPAAPALLAHLGLGLDGLRTYRFRDANWQGAEVRISRTGYTGEDGAELFCPAERAAALWQAVVDAGAVPCGLGCRDTLRLEAAMPLYGHELSRAVTPIEAGLGFAVDPEGGFIGAERVLAQLAHGSERRLVGLRMRSRRVPRQDYPVLHAGIEIGRITSGTLSPTLGEAIGLAYVAAAQAESDTVLTVDIRGQPVEAEVVPLPFYRRV